MTRTKSQRQKRNNRNKRSGKGGGRDSSTLKGLRSIKQMPEQTRSIRYYFDDTTSPVVITSADLLHIMGSVTNGATTYSPLIQSVKLLRVTMTLMANASTGACAGYLQWQGQNAPSQKLEVISTQGIESSRSFEPPHQSSCEWWWDLTSTATPIFAIDLLGITATPVAYIDLHFTYVLADGAVANVPLVVASTFTGLAYRFLGNGAFPLGFNPVGLNAVH